MARALRKSANPAEAILWRELRGHRLGNHKFTRQYPIGPTLVDFCCRARKLVVEIDGTSQFDNAIINRGYRVLRLSNAAVLQNLSETRDIILAALEDQLEKQIADLDARYVEM